jgi:hypothetical protein
MPQRSPTYRQAPGGLTPRILSVAILSVGITTTTLQADPTARPAGESEGVSLLDHAVAPPQPLLPEYPLTLEATPERGADTVPLPGVVIAGLGTLLGAMAYRGIKSSRKQ